MSERLTPSSGFRHDVSIAPPEPQVTSGGTYVHDESPQSPSPDYQPEPDSASNAALREWVQSVFFLYGVLVDKPLELVSRTLLGALAPDQFGPLATVDGSPHVFAALPGYQACSRDYEIDRTGWQIAVFGLASPGGEASSMLWWSQGSGEETMRFHSHLLAANLPDVVRSISGTSCVVIEGGVAENTFDLEAILSRRGRWPELSSHELGHRLASWRIASLTR